MTMEKHIMKTSLVFIAALSLVMVVAAEARADGVAIAPEAIPAEQRDALAQLIAQAKASHPETFAAVAAVDTYTTQGMKKVRSGKPEAARAFMRLGRPALLPMIELVAFDARRGDLTEEQWNALGRGLLHAISFLRDPRSAPVLEAVFKSSQHEEFMLKAGEGLGMLCGSRQQKLLLSGSKDSGPQRLAAIAGLGYCRTKASAERLAAIMAESNDAETAKITAKSLGYVGSSWGLQADKSIPADRAETIRRIASEALVDHYARYGKKVRKEMGHAVLMVEHPASVGRIESARRRASGAIATELDDLRGRLETSLARSSR
jgi:hypothetical protein